MLILTPFEVSFGMERSLNDFDMLSLKKLLHGVEGGMRNQWVNERMNYLLI